MSQPQRLQEIFRSVFNLSDSVDPTSIHQLGFPAWDSLAHVTLMAAIESEFGVAIDLADSIELTSYDAILAHLEDVMP
ncbi:MAG TPA: acyl carrier protein [Gemmatimonas sp.]|uniref:acyl carrier protein n=1 Tax=Gemmatimonas sp. TaxID=1962908 RepID=UPI002ED83C6D